MNIWLIKWEKLRLLYLHFSWIFAGLQKLRLNTFPTKVTLVEGKTLIKVAESMQLLDSFHVIK